MVSSVSSWESMAVDAPVRDWAAFVKPGEDEDTLRLDLAVEGITCAPPTLAASDKGVTRFNQSAVRCRWLAVVISRMTVRSVTKNSFSSSSVASIMSVSR